MIRIDSQTNMHYYDVNPFRVVNVLYPGGNESKYYEFASFVIHWLIADSTDAAAVFEKLLKKSPIGTDPKARANEYLGTSSSNFSTIDQDLWKIKDNEDASEFVKASLYMSKHIQLSLNDWLDDVLTIDTGGQLVDKEYASTHSEKFVVLISWFPMQLLYFLDTVEVAFEKANNVSMDVYFERIKTTRDVCKGFLRWILIDGDGLDYAKFSVSRGTLYNLSYVEFFSLCEDYFEQRNEANKFLWYISGLLNFSGDERTQRFVENNQSLNIGIHQDLQIFSRKTYEFMNLAIEFSHLMAMLTGTIALRPKEKNWLDILFVTDIDDNQEFSDVSGLNNYVRFTNVHMVTLYKKVGKFHTFYKEMIDAHEVIKNKSQRDFPDCSDEDYSVLSGMSYCVSEYKPELESRNLHYDDPKISEIFVGLLWVCGYRYFVISRIANLEANYSVFTGAITNSDFSFDKNKKLIDSAFGARSLLLAAKLSKKLPLPDSTPKLEVYFDQDNSPKIQKAKAPTFIDRIRNVTATSPKLMDQEMKLRLHDYLVVS